MAASRFALVRDDASGVSVLSVSGELDNAAVPQFEQALLLALCDRDVVIDLGGLGFMDSTALAALVRGRRKAATLGLRLHLADPSTTVSRLLQTTDVARLFDTYPSVMEALRTLSASSAGGLPTPIRGHERAGEPVPGTPLSPGDLVADAPTTDPGRVQ